jgi:hypothetical protein
LFVAVFVVEGFLAAKTVDTGSEPWRALAVGCCSCPAEKKPRKRRRKRRKENIYTKIGRKQLKEGRRAPSRGREEGLYCVGYPWW